MVINTCLAELKKGPGCIGLVLLNDPFLMPLKQEEIVSVTLRLVKSPNTVVSEPSKVINFF